MSAELIMEAVRKLRTMAQGATPGPWWSEDSDNHWVLHGVATRLPAQGFIPEQIVNSQILKAPKRKTPYAEYWPNNADGHLITAMAVPTVALFVADFLESVALAYPHRPDGTRVVKSAERLAMLILDKASKEDPERGVEVYKVNDSLHLSGSCSVCGKVRTLKKNGTLRWHTNPDPAVWPPERCNGSGEAPKSVRQ